MLISTNWGDGLVVKSTHDLSHINLEVVWVVAKLSVQVISDQYKGLTEVFILLLFFSIKKTHTESMWERERERERENWFEVGLVLN